MLFSKFSVFGVFKNKKPRNQMYSPCHSYSPCYDNTKQFSETESKHANSFVFLFFFFFGSGLEMEGGKLN